jgi:hypothetical protein
MCEDCIHAKVCKNYKPDNNSDCGDFLSALDVSTALSDTERLKYLSCRCTDGAYEAFEKRNYDFIKIVPNR